MTDTCFLRGWSVIALTQRTKGPPFTVRPSSSWSPFSVKPVSHLPPRSPVFGRSAHEVLQWSCRGAMHLLTSIERCPLAQLEMMNTPA
ncbi:hypothetical protein NUW54_g5 [Trametes sanguinea]|uniref:Uncharacterized protein n=1 Tax=Trametes sanguinea TaxID=158606 RepID=A0ACC1QBU0_9APHY|nr:hypothetical protein NUW54_g5 [Trametes sanguinea]